MTYLNVSHFRVRHEHVCNALLRSPAGVSRDCVDVNQNVIGKFLGGASGRKLQGFVGFRREFGALLGKKKIKLTFLKKPEENGRQWTVQLCSIFSSPWIKEA